MSLPGYLLRVPVADQKEASDPRVSSPPRRPLLRRWAQVLGRIQVGAHRFDKLQGQQLTVRAGPAEFRAGQHPGCAPECGSPAARRLLRHLNSQEEQNLEGFWCTCLSSGSPREPTLVLAMHSGFRENSKPSIRSGFYLVLGMPGLGSTKKKKTNKQRKRSGEFRQRLHYRCYLHIIIYVDILLTLLGPSDELQLSGNI